MLKKYHACIPQFQPLPACNTINVNNVILFYDENEDNGVMLIAAMLH